MSGYRFITVGWPMISQDRPGQIRLLIVKALTLPAKNVMKVLSGNENAKANAWHCRG